MTERGPLCATLLTLTLREKEGLFAQRFLLSSGRREALFAPHVLLLMTIRETTRAAYCTVHTQGGREGTQGGIPTYTPMVGKHIHHPEVYPGVKEASLASQVYILGVKEASLASQDHERCVKEVSLASQDRE